MNREIRDKIRGILRQDLEEHGKDLRLVLERLASVGEQPTDLAEESAHEIACDLEAALAILRADRGTKIIEALARIDKTSDFGICQECRQEIEIKRLRAVPFAERCRGCQEIYEADPRNHNPLRQTRSALYADAD